MTRRSLPRVQHPDAPPIPMARIASRTVLYSVLAGWGALTALRNLNQSQALLYKFTRFGLTVPNYRFFGPTPATHDLELLVRDRDNNGVLSGWHEVIVGEPRRPLHTIWAPFRRPEKGLNDAIREIQRHGANVIDHDYLRSTTGYQMLLNVARHQIPHDPGARQVQFAICLSAAHEPQIAPRVSYLSRFHDLDTGQVTTPP